MVNSPFSLLYYNRQMKKVLFVAMVINLTFYLHFQKYVLSFIVIDNRGKLCLPGSYSTPFWTNVA